MSEADSTVEEEEAKTAEVEKQVRFKEFLEKVHSSVSRSILDLWEVDYQQGAGRRRRIIYPDLRLHCQTCEGERTFRLSTSNSGFSFDLAQVNIHPTFRCGDCHQGLKSYSLLVMFDGDGCGRLYKYGERPAFGIPVPNRVLRLFGKVDGELFLKGRQCEGLGYGIAAFAYYRRVVENHRNELFDEIIKVCKTVNAPAELLEELAAAKKEISFAKSMEKIKTGLPQGLLIDGQNPLNALHSALSLALHGESDAECLAMAQAVRLVLSDLVERIALLKQENQQLSDAVHRLIAKKQGRP